MLKKCGCGAGAGRRYAATTRRKVVAAIRTGGMARSQAARRFGVPSSTIFHWLHRSETPVPAFDPGTWSVARREAAARIHDNPTVAPGDWAAMLGHPAREASALAARCGYPARRGRARPAGWESAELARRLARHLARQIAALDAGLSGREPDGDTAKILRDLAGLKRLLDGLDAGRAAGGGTRHGKGS